MIRHDDQRVDFYRWEPIGQRLPLRNHHLPGVVPAHGAVLSHHAEKAGPILGAHGHETGPGLGIIISRQANQTAMAPRLPILTAAKGHQPSDRKASSKVWVNRRWVKGLAFGPL
jgi:hypothetical protein